MPPSPSTLYPPPPYMYQINVRFIIKFLGTMHMLESLFMLCAVGISFWYDDSDLIPLSISCAIMFLAGLIMYLFGRRADDYHSGRREGMLCVTLTWILLSLFGMLPYLISGAIPHVADAFFETISGFTTTGATILNDIERLPHGLLFWRSLTQWQGGIGMIVFTVAILPIFGGTASQLFDAETPGITHERFRPRITEVAKRIFGLYLLITMGLLLLLWAGPMNLFDALNHAMTTVSTGGYSTKNLGLAYWHSAYTEYVVILGMTIGGTNFTLLYFALRGHSQKLFRDHEFRWFCTVIATATIVTTVWILLRHNETNPELAFRHALFHITSLISTTGFLTVDFAQWGSFFAVIALFVIIVAGCAGSTSGGLKMGRFMILIKNLLNEFKRQTHPRAILPLRAGGQVIPEHIIQRVYTFAIIYVGLILFGCTVLTFEGIDLGDALGLAATSVSNAGPGIGHFADGNFSSISAFNKWILSFLMIVGRLEIFTVLTLVLPGFWRR